MEKKFKEGDKVLVFTPTTGWEEATYLAKSKLKGLDHYVKIAADNYCSFKDIDVRDATGNSNVTPTAAIPVPQQQHEYTPGEKVEVCYPSGWVRAVYIQTPEDTRYFKHEVFVLHIQHMDSITRGNIRKGWQTLEEPTTPIQQPTDLTSVQPIPATEQPSDAMSQERFVQEAAIEIYCKHSVAADEAVLDAILLYNEIQTQLSK